MPASTYNACADLLDRNVEEGRGDRLAFIDPERKLSYGELQAETRRFARLLQTLGVRREERIALAMLDTVEMPIAFLGAMRAGVVPIPLNTLLVADQYAYMLADSRARALCVSSALLPVLEPIVSKLPDLAHLIVVGGDAPPHAIDFRQALSSEPALFDTAVCHADEPAFWKNRVGWYRSRKSKTTAGVGRTGLSTAVAPTDIGKESELPSP
jgi:4-hydroxybenzoate-CoA ligase